MELLFLDVKHFRCYNVSWPSIAKYWKVRHKCKCSCLYFISFMYVYVDDYAIHRQQHTL